MTKFKKGLLSAVGGLAMTAGIANAQAVNNNSPTITYTDVNGVVHDVISMTGSTYVPASSAAVDSVPPPAAPVYAPPPPPEAPAPSAAAAPVGQDAMIGAIGALADGLSQTNGEVRKILTVLEGGTAPVAAGTGPQPQSAGSNAAGTAGKKLPPADPNKAFYQRPTEQTHPYVQLINGVPCDEHGKPINMHTYRQVAPPAAPAEVVIPPKSVVFASPVAAAMAPPPAAALPQPDMSQYVTRDELKGYLRQARPEQLSDDYADMVIDGMRRGFYVDKTLGLKPGITFIWQCATLYVFPVVMFDHSPFHSNDLTSQNLKQFNDEFIKYLPSGTSAEASKAVYDKLYFMLTDEDRLKLKVLKEMGKHRDVDKAERAYQKAVQKNRNHPSYDNEESVANAKMVLDIARDPDGTLAEITDKFKENLRKASTERKDGKYTPEALILQRFEFDQVNRCRSYIIYENETQQQSSLKINGDALKFLKGDTDVLTASIGGKVVAFSDRTAVANVAIAGLADASRFKVAAFTKYQLKDGFAFAV